MFNRFEHNKPHFMRRFMGFLPIAAFLILFFIFLRGITTVNDTTLEKQKESLENALSRSISQCYAVEGVYPPSLEYLEEHYGLLYDKEIFFIDYQIFASNMLPDVTVIRRTGQSFFQ